MQPLHTRLVSSSVNSLHFLLAHLIITNLNELKFNGLESLISNWASSNYSKFWAPGLIYNVFYTWVNILRIFSTGVVEEEQRGMALHLAS